MDEKKSSGFALKAHLSRVPVLTCQQGFAEVYAVCKFSPAGLDLGADPLVVLLQELHRGDVPDEKRNIWDVIAGNA